MVIHCWIVFCYNVFKCSRD